MSLDTKEQKSTSYTSPIFKVIFNGETLSTSFIDSIEIYYDIKSLCPVGVLRINDMSSLTLNCGEIGVGTEFDISIEDGDSDIKPSFNFEKFYVKGIHSSFPFEESDNPSANIMELLLVTRWELEQDYKSHAYPPEIVSKTIQKVLDESLRGFDIRYDSSDIVSSSDLGNKPRYKYGIGDKDFIEKKLLPYCVSNSEPCFAFLNEAGWFYLTTYSRMIANKSLACLITDPSDFTSTDVASAGSFSSLLTFKLKSFDTLPDLYQHLNVETVIRSEVENKIRMLKAGIRSNFGDGVSQYLPVEKNYFSEIEDYTTKKRYIEGIDLDSYCAVDLQSVRDELDIIKVVGECNFSSLVSIGFPVYLLNPGRDKKISVLSTNYIASSIKYYSVGNDLRARMELGLSTPGYVSVGSDNELLSKNVLGKTTN